MATPASSDKPMLPSDIDVSVLPTTKEAFDTGRALPDTAEDLRKFLEEISKTGVEPLDDKHLKELFVKLIPKFDEQELSSLLKGEFSDKTIGILKQAVSELSDKGKSPVKELVESFKLLDRIISASLTQLEKPGDVNTHGEWLRTAFFFETKIKNVTVVATKLVGQIEYYSKEVAGSPRSIQYDRENNLVYFGAKKGRSVVKAAGAFKTARSIMQIDLGKITAPPEFHVRLFTKSGFSEQAMGEVLQEKDINIKYRGKPGIAQLKAWSECTSMRSGKLRMEFVCVGAQGDATAMKGVLREPKALLQFMGGCLDGLDTLHKDGVMHTDIKPGNLLVMIDPVTKEVRGYVADLGGVEDLRALQLIRHGIYRTPKYTAPELLFFTGKRLPEDKLKIDLWALGLSLYELRFEKTIPTLNEIPRAFDLLRYSQRCLEAKDSESRKALLEEGKEFQRIWSGNKENQPEAGNFFKAAEKVLAFEGERKGDVWKSVQREMHAAEGAIKEMIRNRVINGSEEVRGIEDEVERNQDFLVIAEKKEAGEVLSPEEELDYLIYSMMRTDPKDRIDLATAEKERDRILALFD